MIGRALQAPLWLAKARGRQSQWLAAEMEGH